MRYKDIILAILSTKNGAITTANNVHYENIHTTVRLYSNVTAKDNGASLCKSQMQDLLDSIMNPKLKVRPVGSKKLK